MIIMIGMFQELDKTLFKKDLIRLITIIVINFMDLLNNVSENPLTKDHLWKIIRHGLNHIKKKPGIRHWISKRDQSKSTQNQDL